MDASLRSQFPPSIFRRTHPQFPPDTATAATRRGTAAASHPYYAPNAPPRSGRSDRQPRKNKARVQRRAGRGVEEKRKTRRLRDNEAAVVRTVAHFETKHQGAGEDTEEAREQLSSHREGREDQGDDWGGRRIFSHVGRRLLTIRLCCRGQKRTCGRKRTCTSAILPPASNAASPALLLHPRTVRSPQVEHYLPQEQSNNPTPPGRAVTPPTIQQSQSNATTSPNNPTPGRALPPQAATTAIEVVPVVVRQSDGGGEEGPPRRHPHHHPSARRGETGFAAKRRGGGGRGGGPERSTASAFVRNVGRNGLFFLQIIIGRVSGGRVGQRVTGTVLTGVTGGNVLREGIHLEGRLRTVRRCRKIDPRIEQGAENSPC